MDPREFENQLAGTPGTISGTPQTKVAIQRSGPEKVTGEPAQTKANSLLAKAQCRYVAQDLLRKQLFEPRTTK